MKHTWNAATLASGLSAITLLGCGLNNTHNTAEFNNAQVSPPKRAILLASHGDIDNPETELKPYIETSFQKNVGIPLPRWSRDILTGPAYALSIKTVRSQYDKIGPTNYKSNSELQRIAVQNALNAQGVNVKVYLGYNFTPPLIEDTLAQMKKDGIEEFVVVNKGAQFSYASTGENMEDTLSYLHKHPEWNVKAVGVRQYSNDPRFVNALKNGIERDLQKTFLGESPENTCVLVASHGLPMWLINKGDPAVRQMLATFETLKKQLPQYKLFHGFLNDDFIPGAAWVAPKAINVVEPMQSAGCKNILMDGRLSFTTHHRATLFDLNIEAREKFETAAELTGENVNIALAPNFDADAEFATFIASLTQEAFAGKGHLTVLKQKNMRAIPQGEAGTPGKFSLEL
jgi:ferrochelatase